MGKFSFRQLFKPKNRLSEPDNYPYPAKSLPSGPSPSNFDVNCKPKLTLPTDLIPLITSFADQPTLAVLARTNKYFNKLAIPLLYRHVKLFNAQAVKYFCLYMFCVKPEDQIKLIRSIHIHFELLKWDVDLFTLRKEWPEIAPQPWATAILYDVPELVITSSGPTKIAGNNMAHRTLLDDLVGDWLNLLVGIYGPRRSIGKHYTTSEDPRNNRGGEEEKEGVNWSEQTLFNLMCRWKNLQYLSLPVIPYRYNLLPGLLASLESPKGPYKFLKEIEIHSTSSEQFGGNGAALVQWLDAVSRRNGEWMDQVKEKNRKDREEYEKMGIPIPDKMQGEEPDRRILLRIREPTENSSIGKVNEWIDGKEQRNKVFKTADEGRALGS
ncbi:hypothetical protein I204_01981 [Kwoniella mangroviensis CBS 8886]|uniref:uncharacterized protein n=1 Tax=Kwoniella mangroviensis CBS 8507 TaxID=1296122 RepID=UPI00080D185F|nr:uncharacterized protein I203_03713 [Kwoniella mangroviensis CBS 8507]OCF67030.1 hypothetical protein I203_03713 [Kwoniella mangroviensis CBS 8507]OCF77976.1 hypothetical protein I204_01981 [Kwoniella mangroviensis CBS 8886]